jgi:putative membrane protein
MRYFLTRVVVAAIGLAIAAWLVSGIWFDEPAWWRLIIVAVVFGFINATVGLILKIGTLPLIVLTLGIALLFVNAFVLWLVGWLTHWIGFHVDGFWSAFWGAIIVSLVSVICNAILRRLQPPSQSVIYYSGPA